MIPGSRLRYYVMYPQFKCKNHAKLGLTSEIIEKTNG
jgi:hypothetical protein